MNKLSKILGLEILNLNLKKVIDKKLKIKLNDLFVKNKVLVLRKQFMNPNEFQKATEIFGKIRIEQISNYSDEQTLGLIDKLTKHVISLKFKYRHQWKVGDFVIWDNRTLMHKANDDYDMSEKRFLYS